MGQLLLGTPRIPCGLCPFGKELAFLTLGVSFSAQLDQAVFGAFLVEVCLGQECRSTQERPLAFFQACSGSSKLIATLDALLAPLFQVVFELSMLGTQRSQPFLYLGQG